MSKSISVTITVGEGSEIHNHDLEYRSTLKHVHGQPEDVIELVEYKSYKEQINELVKPYIDAYNKRQEGRYKAAWERYNSGQIKTKPRKANYKPMGYDYYEEHINDTYFNRASMKHEQLPMWRSLILGLGDKQDRQEGTISRDQAVAVITAIVNDWPELYPDFKLLGATIHMDEEGFYHAHIDYKPLYECENGQGLDVGIGHESALERMGYEPEQSVINASDKVPIRFNGFRNKLYLEVEKRLVEEGLRLEYDVSRRKDPNKNSSKNQKLESWQATRDNLMDLQHAKNHMLDIVKGDKVSPEGYKAFLQAAAGVEESLEEIEKQPRSRLGKDNVVVPFRLFDQLKSFVKSLLETIEHLLQRLDVLEENYQYAKEDLAELEDLREENADLKRQLQAKPDLNMRMDLIQAQKDAARYKKQLLKHGIQPEQSEPSEFRTQEKTRE